MFNSQLIKLEGVMKRSILLGIFIAIILNGVAFGALNSYPVNSSPATEDRMLGIDDPTGTWSTKLFSLSSIFNLFQSQNYNFTGAVDFSNATSISSGPLIFTSSVALPEAVDGRLFYYSGLGYDAFGFYSVTTPRYILDYGAAPTVDGQVIVYRESTGFGWETPSVGSSGLVETPPTYRDSTGTKGQYAYSSNGLMRYDCVSTNLWMSSTLTDSLSATPTTPTVVSRTIGLDGVTFTEVYSVSCSVGSGGSGGHALSDGKTFTYSSGLPGTSAVYTLSTPVLPGASVTASYTQPGNGIEATSGGLDLASYTTQAVTNRSEYTEGGTTVTDPFDGAESPLVTNWSTWTSPGWGGFQKTGGVAYGLSAEWNGSYWDANQLANNQYGKITISGSPNYQCVMVRQNTSGCYIAYVHSSGTRIYVNRFDVSGAVWTNLVSGASYITTTVPANATLELRFSGSTPTVFVNGSPAGTLINDSTYASGNAGVASYGVSGGITSFEAGDL